MKKSTCPCCDGDGVIDELPPSVGLSKSQRLLYVAVISKPDGAMHERLVDQLYADRPDGGPLRASDVVRSLMSGMNKKLRSVDQRIIAKGSQYRLHRNYYTQNPELAQ